MSIDKPGTAGQRLLLRLLANAHREMDRLRALDLRLYERPEPVDTTHAWRVFRGTHPTKGDQ